MYHDNLLAVFVIVDSVESVVAFVVVSRFC
jgi:hypothetical protein